jgi:hypothetical protein
MLGDIHAKSVHGISQLDLILHKRQQDITPGC